MRRLVLALSAALLVFATASCGDNMFKGMDSTSTEEAMRFEVSRRLDAGDYAWVLSHPELAGAIDYSAAAMGLAGLDPADLIIALNNVSNSAGISNDLSPVTGLSLNPEALQYLNTSQTMLQAELNANPNDPDLNFQMTMTSLTSAITALAQAGETNSGSIAGGFDASDGISQTEAQNLGTFINANPGVQVDTDGDNVPDTSLVTVMANDVNTVNSTLPNAALGANSDLYQVLSETTSGQGSIDYDGDGTVTAGDITNYLTQVLGQ